MTGSEFTSSDMRAIRASCDCPDERFEVEGPEVWIANRSNLLMTPLL
ncbi:unnamed protein product [Fusarium venenatum]|uniref:Uncharacterized protein n=1 Tax=Fusarium venenatum TaxID=56646 RepID=A0A2L2U170_9HYPO|nr:uncharacterized protein FVRRES_04247 [Fusarium venenatum]CEI67735.1 unnamed protein product [Fusarium venenatum]